MLKLFRSAVVLGVVVAAGAGCSKGKDEVTKDVFNAPAPKVIPADKSDTELFLSEIQNNSRPLDLEDVLDFSNSLPVKIAIKSGCDSNSVTYSDQFEFTDTKTVKVISLIPRPLLNSGKIDTSKLSCGFEFHLYNSAGSQKVFFVANIQISELVASSVTIQKGVDPIGSMEFQPSFSLSDADQVRVRFKNTNTSSAKVVCEQFQFEPIGIDNSIGFSEFDITNPIFHIEGSATILTAKPEQSCRVLILANSRVIALSSLFKYSPQPPAPPEPPPGPLPKLEVSIISLPKRNDTTGFVDTLNAFKEGKHVPYSTILLRNGSTETRTFRVSKAQRIDANAFTYWQEIPHRDPSTELLRISAPFIQLIPSQINGGTISEDSYYWTISMGPGASFNLEVVFAPDTPCDVKHISLDGRLIGVGIEALGKGSIDEIVNNEVKETTEFSLGEILVAPASPDHPQKDLIVLPLYTGGPWR